MAIGGLIVALILLWLFLKKNPNIVKQIESAIAPLVPGDYVVEQAGAYTPHDFPLPALNNGFFVNFGCNFCSKTNVQVAPPTMPVSYPAQPSAPQITYQAPFGGGGTSYGTWYG